MRYFIILFFVFFSSSTTVNSQWVTIPDQNFVTWLDNNGYSAALNGSDLDTTHTLVTSATTIDCSSSGITDLTGIQYFDNLNILTCKYNNLISLPGLSNTLTQLICFGNTITGTLNLPPNLQVLNCNYNQITAISSLPPTLQYLDCYNNQISALPALPNSLTYLNCSMNFLSVLPTLPTGLSYLDCSVNTLTFLPTLPNSLTNLFCVYNLIAALPALPGFLQYLNCNYNPIISLPALPASLVSLSCSGNQLTTLPSLPSGLQYLECQNNQLNSISSLPPTLGHLYCNNNLLTTLPVLPSTLEYLQANNNQITSLPNFPAGLTTILLYNNLITSLPELPNQIYSLAVQNNPFLSCLPELTAIAYLNFMNTNVQCLPNYGNVTSSLPSLTTFPLCDILNPNSCDFYYNIAGQIYGDANTNCVQEFNESLFAGIKVNLLQSGNLLQQALSSQGGHYTFDCTIGTFDITVDTSAMPFVVGCPVGGILNSVLTVSDSVDLGMDFGLQCKTGFDVGAFAFAIQSGLFFPADTVLVQLKAGDMALFYNLSCANGISGTVTINFTGPVQYGGNFPGSLVPVYTPNTLTYTVPDFGALNANTAFRFYLVTDTTAQNGQSVCFVADVMPLSGDNLPGNNTLSFCSGIVNSFDPNQKEVSPLDSIYQFTEWLTYTIRFQNTGTAPAQHIVLTDTLSANLREETFTFLGSSHNPYINITGNVVKFTFPNINLPDSTNDEPNSHGYVQFKIKPDGGLPIGSTIENTAAIYFDFNPPVITNTTVNTLVSPTGITENNSIHFAIYPNPANDFITIHSSNSGLHSITLTDFTGRNVFESEFSGNEFQIDVSGFTPGMYFAVVENLKIRNVRKIVVQ